MCVAENVELWFSKRLEEALALIKNYDLHYEEIGLFGSYARNSYKSTSDIDICVITDKKPERRISGSLREEAELLHVDIVFVTREYFINSLEPFAKQLRADYRRIV